MNYKSIINFDLYQSYSGYLVVRMSRKHNRHVLCIEWALSIGVATLANKKALFVMPVDRIH